MQRRTQQNTIFTTAAGTRAIAACTTLCQNDWLTVTVRPMLSQEINKSAVRDQRLDKF